LFADLLMSSNFNLSVPDTFVLTKAGIAPCSHTSRRELNRPPPSGGLKNVPRVAVVNSSIPASIKAAKLQRGFTERLLCAECDNIRLGQNETYFARALERGPLPNTTVTKRLLVFRDLDYKRTKNYFLSILWRMSISSLEIFKDVSLGPKHEEALRLGFDQGTEASLDLPISAEPDSRTKPAPYNWQLSRHR
jgi:hypothetical protein